jgi:DedD protein
MDSSQDTEITLGTGKLLGLFFGLVIICALFFSLGYTLGRKSEPVAAAAPVPTIAKANNPPPAQPESTMSFYKSVEQKDANAQLSPASSDAPSIPPATLPNAGTEPSGSAVSPAASATAPPSSTTPPPDPMAVPTSAYYVQVAAVTKQEDADALVEALKKKQYPAFVAATTTTDKLFHVQLGPFTDIKDAEGMRSRLINDGYNPIVKK